MTQTAHPTLTQTIFHVEITDDHAIVLPPELREQMGIEAGDVVAVSVLGDSAFVHKVSKTKATQPMTTEPVPELRGLLEDYFTDREDVRRFIEEERGN
jgi:bifunctional DNA-binding transcriptional regulator/antitoxin component of YhaV-PrlF toxin-antitoxin module